MAASSPSKKFAPKQWKKTNIIDLEVPSGQLCQVRRPGVTGLITAGLLDSIDTLTSIVKTEHIDRVAKGEEPKPVTATNDAVVALSQDKEKLADAMHLVDRIVEYVVLQPQLLRPVRRDDDGKPILVHEVDRATGEPRFNKDNSPKMAEVPLTEEERDPEAVYTDYVDLMDRMYLFQFVVGGVSDLNQFRAEFSATLGSLESGEAVQGTAVSPS